MSAENLEILVCTKAMLQEDRSLPSLLHCYRTLKEATGLEERGRRLLAETCYLLAHDLIDTDEQRAIAFAEEAIELYESIDTDTLSGAMPILIDYLPEVMHEGVVNHRILNRLGVED